MPNWVASRITLSGEDKDIKRVFENHITEEEGEKRFDFNTIIEMPEELHIPKSTSVDRGIKLVKEMGENADLSVLSEEEKEWFELGKKALSNEEKYGYTDWYEWSRDIWGTKWNACNSRVYEEINQIEFDTAWTPMSQRLLKVFSRLNPNVEITFEFAEEQSGYWAGRMVLQNGSVLEEEEFDENTKECYEMYFSLWGGEEEFDFVEEQNTYVWRGDWDTCDDENNSQ